VVKGRLYLGNISKQSKAEILSDNSSSLRNYIKFLLPSLVGIGLFLTPVTYDGKQTIVVGVLANGLMAWLGEMLPLIITIIFVLSGLISFVVSVFKPRSLASFEFTQEVFNTTWIWLSLRILGGVLCTMTYLQLGPEWVISADTGQVAYIDIAGIILCIIFVANILLPLLTDFGFFEFVGTMISRIFQAIFGLPGRASLDALTSWIGDSSIGTILTIRQYESGHYSAREAAVVVTNFSAVSLPFTVVIAQTASIDDKFVLFYMVVAICGIVAALITPRLPPLSGLANSFYQREAREAPPQGPSGSLFRQSLNAALYRAEHAPSVKQQLSITGRSIFDISFAVLPVAMTIEVLVLIVYYHTSVLQWISAPMVYVLQILQLPEADAAAAGTLVGFFDQFIPAIVSTNIDSPITRFVLAGLSVTQLIYMAENGLLILRSKIPISVPQLASIFLIRTIIVLPILSVAAHLIY
jgi:nucleoside recognition membrane protein YjiH